jgi:tripartite-type tricarboxylate transporter receptor subunit TctC
MINQRIISVASSCLFAMACIINASALAQTGKIGAAAKFPEKPIRIISPSTPGGANDVLARIVGTELTKAWGKPAIVDNRPGAGGVIGAEIVAKSPPNGYTLLVVPTAHTVNPFLYTKLPYDTVRDFSPVTILTLTTNVLIVHPKVPANSINELIALAKAKPGLLTYAHSGVGTGGFLCAELMKKMARLDMVGVAYKGAGASTIGVLTGEVDMLFTSLVSAMQYIKSGKLRAFATTGLQRSRKLPDVPTLSESGLSGFQKDSWFGLLAAAGTPSDIVLKLQGQLSKSFHSADVVKALDAMGFEPVCDSPDNLAALIKSEMTLYSKLIQDAGIKPEVLK